VLKVFDATVSEIHLKMADNDHQSRTLATLRDTLLPKLLSGEVMPCNVGYQPNQDAI
jgi:type I restriction enzyme S subunit